MALVFSYEALGTMLFVYIMLISSEPIAIAFAFFASTIIFGGITGGHFNPAVTLAVYIKEGKWKQNAAWLGQIITA